MIQVYCADDKDFIIEYENFDDKDIIGIVSYINICLKEEDVYIIKIRKWGNVEIQERKK